MLHKLRSASRSDRYTWRQGEPRAMLLHELIEGLPITVARGDASSVRVGDLTEDSRTALPGSIFVARSGQKTDGRLFAGEAVRSGASAILAEFGSDLSSFPEGVVVATARDVRMMTALLSERLHSHPSGRLLLVGVTGTNGKSTVTHLAHQILNRCGLRCGMIGTVQVDDGTEIAPSAMTTPPAAELSRTLATMVEAGCDAAVMEVSSHALDQSRTAALSFDAAVFTNVTGDHLDYHETMEHYLATKRLLLGQLDAGAGGPAVLNADDPLLGSSAAARPVWCSLAQRREGGWLGHRDEIGLDGEVLRLEHDGGEIRARVPLLGAHNAMNTMQAVAVSWEMLSRAGVEPSERARSIGDALTLVHAPPGRLEPVWVEGDDVRVFVDYAHTHDALERVLGSLRGLTPEGAALWCVFGCGGEKDQTKRPRMGCAVVRGADHAVLTSDNPRRESPSRIVAGVLSEMTKEERERVIIHMDRGVAIRSAIDRASAGDVVLIAGKGHETTQVVSDGRGGVYTEPWDDREVARGALAARRVRLGRVRPGGLREGAPV